jgi:mono/diheme cytochrome c family protein
MQRADKEAYLREYAQLKAEGKPFFPYAVAKDGIMAIIVMIVIIFMSLILGGDLGPKADATTTTYVPRPEWYYFFLFELLRVIKPPELVFVATFLIPNVALVLLALLPFYDRSPERRPQRRPVAMTAMVLTIAGMLYLTLLGAFAGSPTEIELETEPRYEFGAEVVAQAGCLGCHKIAENGNDGPGPNLTKIGAKLPPQAIARTLDNPTAPMPSFKDLPPEKKQAMVDYLGSLR